jgi:hypothetical protein
MTIFSHVVFLICAAVFLMAPTLQTPRTYKISNIESVQEVLNEVVKIERINNLTSSRFPEEFELEVTNISKKPIYFMNIMVKLPKTPNLEGLEGKLIVFDLSFGDRKFTDVSRRPDPTDVPINPGKLGTLKLGNNMKSIRPYLAKRLSPGDVEVALSQVSLAFQIINFGDGTGYIAGQAYPVKRVSQNGITSKGGLAQSFLASEKGEYSKTTPKSSKAQFCGHNRPNGSIECHESGSNCYSQISQNDSDYPYVAICQPCRPCSNPDYGCCNTDVYSACDGTSCMN